VTRRHKAILSGNLHGQYRDVAETVTQFTDEKMDELKPCPENPEQDYERILRHLDEKTSCVVVQNPDVFGHIRDLTPLAEAVHKKGALLVVVVTEAVSFGALKSPGEMGADIVVAEGQSIGCGLNFGGPYLGLFATRDKFVRQIPGRLCGETVDEQGARGYVLTLSTREQHIRREKATSNICTNSGLMALAFTIHMTLLGERGIRSLAMLNHRKACELCDSLKDIPGIEVLNKAFFNEISIKLPIPAAGVVESLAAMGILGGVPASRLYPGVDNVGNILILAATELNEKNDFKALGEGLKEVLK
jgi:glycine dehydrogenase subunit 1